MGRVQRVERYGHCRFIAPRRTPPDSLSPIKLPASEVAKLMTDHVPARLHFNHTSAIVSSWTTSREPSRRARLWYIRNHLPSSECKMSGSILVNGREVSDQQYKQVIGDVDWEDSLMSMLTVYDTVLYSALLRLPKEISVEVKKFRTLEMMNELEIRDVRVGDSGYRSISGGEKRRVSVACELVTSPSILFLDELTPGLDAYNDINDIDSLLSLARTVSFTIHQPRSNIVALFDKAVLFAKGKPVYAGERERVEGRFSRLGGCLLGGIMLLIILIDLM